MKASVIYTVGLTGVGQNFFTLYRFRISERVAVTTFIQNLSTDFDEACIKARMIAGEDEITETYEKRLITSYDEASEIVRLGTSKIVAEESGILTFGKHKHEILTEIFKTDKKYVEWIAKGGNIKDEKSGYWYPTIDEDRPVRQQAIALLIGNGDWIERQGKFMPVDKAQKLDYLDSLTINPNIEDNKRVKGLVVRLLTQPFLIENEFGGKWIYKLVDENNHLYNASSSWRLLQADDINNTWFRIDFTPSLYQGKVYIKRIKLVDGPVEIEEGLIRLENNLDSKRVHDATHFTAQDAVLLEKVSKALDLRKILNTTL